MAPKRVLRYHMPPKRVCSKKKKKKKKKTSEVILVKQRDSLMMKGTQRQNALMKKSIERQKRPWSALPPDLLTQIMERNYSSADQIRFRAFCKSWRQLPIELAVHNTNKLPWVDWSHWTNNDDKEGDEDINDTDIDKPCI